MPTLTGPSSTTEDITMASSGADTLTYTTVATGSVLPVNMQIYVDGVEVAGVALLAKYVGQPFVFTKAGGVPIQGVFASGRVDLTTPSATTVAPTTTSGPAPSSSLPKNDGGTIKSGGAIISNRFEAANKVYDNEREVFASVVVDNDSADKAVSGGVFANKTQKPIAKKVTTTLGGVSNIVLRSGAARPELVKSVNKLETLRTRRFTTAIRENKYNRYTGEFDAGHPVVAVDELATDNAANPTRSNPGQIVYKIGAKVPVSSDYKPKTN